MKAYKVEITIESTHLGKMLEAIKELDLPGCTVIDGVCGFGTHGQKYGEGFSSADANAYIFVVCSQKEKDALATKVAPLLEKAGGVCVCSEVERI